jgi:hypothetical protein
MPRPSGVGNQGNLVGLPYYAKNHRWFVMVQMRQVKNNARWVSKEDFAEESGAEGYWARFKADTAGMDRGVWGVFETRFHRIADYVPPVVTGRVSSEGVMFHVEPAEGKFNIVVETPEGRWVYEKPQASKEHASRLRIGLRKSSRNLRGPAWLGWLNKKFQKEGA